MSRTYCDLIIIEASVHAKQGSYDSGLYKTFAAIGAMDSLTGCSNFMSVSRRECRSHLMFRRLIDDLALCTLFNHRFQTAEQLAIV